MTTITLNTTPQQDNLISQYLKAHNTKLEDLVTEMLLERLEDEEDIKLADQAYAAYQQDSETYSLSEMRKRHGL